MSRVLRAFTLIEILISILILALGLLGLGALFPVVIREQRGSTDQIAGLIAAKNLEAELPYLLEADRPVRYEVLRAGTTGTQITVEARYSAIASLIEPWLLAIGDNPQSRFSVNNTAGHWETDWNWPGFDPGPTEMRDLGLLRINSSTVTQNVSQPDYLREFPASVREAVSRLEAQIRSEGRTPQVQRRRVISALSIPAYERCAVGSGKGSDSPTLVWDIALRRVPADLDSPTGRAAVGDDVQIAVFVRRVDPGIRLPVGRTLFQTLADDSAPPGQRVLPVGVSTSGGTVTPTLDGTGRYSFVLAAYAPDNGPGVTAHFDLVERPDPSSDESFEEQQRWLEDVDVSTGVGAQLAQVGQRLIDNLGNVYRVERVEQYDNGPAGLRRVRLDPAPALTDVRLNTSTNRRRLEQFIFTPQVPVAAFVIDVRVPEVQQ